MTSVAVLHPGAMGSRLAAELVAAGHRVSWVAEGRSTVSARRADAAGLFAIGWSEVAGLDVVLASCAPQGAVGVAEAVAAAGFAGLYVEANPTSPATLDRVVAALPDARAVVDASVIGPPPAAGEGTTHLLVSGPAAVEEVAALWSGTAVVPVPAGDRLGQASAVKCAYATYSKGRQALALLARELAGRADVSDVLAQQGFRPGADLLVDSDLAADLAERAWRWAPEFDEIAATAEAHGVDPGPARAVADVWRRLEPPRAT